MTTKEKLNQLGSLREITTSLSQELDELEEQAFLNCPDLNEQRHRLLKERNELAPILAEITSEIKKEVLANGESVKADQFHAILCKGKTTWDGKKLEGFALAYPEIDKCKKVGSPLVSIREVKGEK